jgi:hypothetical protein
MWGWLKPILDSLIEWLERKAKEPRTIENAKTPETIRSSWAAYLADKLRQQSGGSGQPK